VIILTRETISRPNKHYDPKKMGWSHVVKAKGTFIFISGQSPIGEDNKIIGPGDIAAQVRRVFQNLETALDSAGASTDDLVKLTIYLTNIEYFDIMKKIRSEYVKSYPAMTTVIVTSLCRPDIMVEIEAIAVTS
jgi:enamine deaminase RidA (YjgF/YER057c/UK114 family)